MHPRHGAVLAAGEHRTRVPGFVPLRLSSVELKELPMSLTVLIVNAADDDRRYCARLLRRWGCVVLERSDSRGLFELMAREQPSAVLLDMDLPFMAGDEVCHSIKSNP